MMLYPPSYVNPIIGCHRSEPAAALVRDPSLYIPMLIKHIDQWLIHHQDELLLDKSYHTNMTI